MARPFGIVDDKLAEAEFFLCRFNECRWKINEANYYFNAFVSSTRSVTFALQASLKGAVGYDAWYAGWQAKLRASKLARFFHNCRTDIQHVGRNFVNGGTLISGEITLLLSVGSFESSTDIPEPNAFRAADYYFRMVCELVADAYGQFGNLIDPDIYYPLAGMRQNSMSFEDIEEELGLPRGWTQLPTPNDFTDEDRMSCLRESAAISNCRALLERYLPPPPDVWD